MLFVEVFLSFFLFYLIVAYSYGLAVDNWEIMCIDRILREGGWVMMTNDEYENIKDRIDALNEEHEEILELMESHNAEKHLGG